jgi:hypothetical protein
MTPRLTNADYVKNHEMTDDKYESKTPTDGKTEKPLHIPHLLNSSYGKTPSTGSDFPIPNATPWVSQAEATWPTQLTGDSHPGHRRKLRIATYHKDDH